MGPEFLAGILIPMSLFATVFGIVYLRSRENMAMIEKGMNPRQQAKSTPRPFMSLKYGLLLIGVGIGLISAYLIDANTHHTHVTAAGTVYESDNPAIYFALIGIGGGIGLVLSYVIEKKHWLDKRAEE